MGYGGISTHEAGCPAIEPQAMTLDRAIETLNQNCHRIEGAGLNFPGPYWHLLNGLVCGPDQYDFLQPFEAIAIAEKYERESR